MISCAVQPGVSILRSSEQSESAYGEYWTRVGSDFPSLKGAASTRYYAECEQLLFDELLPDIAGKSLFKTDLWDEAKNSEILLWAAERGARVAGADIALATIAGARDLLAAHRPAFAAGDVRRIPFRDGSFDLVYSMGTIEHFDETREAVAEIYRVLKPGGRALVGVPNLLDPFLRPVMVAVLDRVGRYDYGLEKAYTHGQLREMLESAGFRVGGRSGILFMPGWLRMADLWLHVRGSRWARLTAAAIRPFAWANRRFPAIRRHGYLIAAVAEKPQAG
jgi:SAM-dependent methyltransferase